MLCILIAGPSVSGKTTLVRYLASELLFPMFSKGEFKEATLRYHRFFHSRAEKIALGIRRIKAIYHSAGAILSAGGCVIWKNNFKLTSRADLEVLPQKHSCCSITVLLTGSYQAIYRRFLKRKLLLERHRGHIVNNCYSELSDETRSKVFINFSNLFLVLQSREWEF